MREVPEGPAIVIGNEFLDALPVRQFVRMSGKWWERIGCASTSDGQLAFDVSAAPEPYINANAANGEILEVNPAAHRFMFETRRAAREDRAARLCSSTTAIWSPGSATRLQALRAHRYVDPLAAPGDCDLTAHVDFAAMARSARADQGDNLWADRSGRLFARNRHRSAEPRRSLGKANAERAEELAQTRARLVGKAKGEMGGLFKAMAVTDRKLPTPPGFGGSSAAGVTTAAP